VDKIKKVEELAMQSQSVIGLKTVRRWLENRSEQMKSSISQLSEDHSTQSLLLDDNEKTQEEGNEEVLEMTENDKEMEIKYQEQFQL